jgi:sugar-specific transcriptional regulator TrmB
VTINSEEIGALESLGLTSIQAKAYLALTQLGRAKAGEIYKNAGVARQDVYRVLEKLQEIGLIEKIVCSPIEYVPTPFCDGLTMLVERKRTEFKETEKKVEKIKDHVFSPNISEQKVLSQNIIATIEKDVLNTKTRRTFGTAMQSIEYVCHWSAFIAGTIELLEETRRAIRRGVKGRTMVERPKNSLTIPKSIQKLIQDYSLEIRTVDSIPFIALGIIDKKEIIFTPMPQRNTQATTYWSKNRGFVELSNSYFETMWNKADPLDLSMPSTSGA